MEQSLQDFLVLKPTNGGIGVFTSSPVPAGAIIVYLMGVPCRRASLNTIQLSETLHIDESGFIDAELNHSCDSNAFVDSSDLTRPAIRALMPIPAGSEVTIDYCASEAELAEPFECRCGSAGCYGTVRGYTSLSAEQRAALGERVSSYLQAGYYQVA
jgi:hypothetical protein